MATAKGKDYTADSVKHLTSVEAVRSKASMYLGELGSAMVFSTLREVVDNFVDEAIEGYCTEGNVYVDEDKSYWAWDNGRGMPVGSMKVMDSVTGRPYTVSSLYAITGLLHAGGKLSAEDSAYAASRGTHGIGIKATNFVSHYFEVWTSFKGQWYNIRYKNGKVAQDVRKLPKAPEHPYKKGLLKSGTLIHFKPDPKIVQADNFPLSLFAEWAKIAAYFTPTLSITLGDWKGRERTWHVPEGPRQYVIDKIEENKCSLIVEGQTPFVHQSALADVIVQWTDYDGCDMQAFTNGLNNPDKGVHFQSFFRALDSALTPYVGKKQKFSLLELREGVVGLVNAKLASPKFSSQTKDKLVDERADEPLSKLLQADLTAFFKKNRKLAESICARADQLRALRSQFTASKKVLQVLSKARTKGLPAKCQSSPNCKTEQRELYLVEGDSAGGSGKNARDPFYQEILPLKGKIMNAMKAKPEVLLTSEEVVNIFTMVGFDAKAEDPIARLRCGGGLFLLADPDPDGSHINCLLISALYKYMPSLFSMGLVYVVNAPEWFAVNKAGKLLHAPTKAQLQQVLKEAGTPNLDIRHVKGYGELDAKFLRMLAFDPATRLCTRVTTDNAKSVQRFVALMSDDVQARRDLLGV